LSSLLLPVLRAGYLWLKCAFMSDDTDWLFFPSWTLSNIATHFPPSV